MSEEFTEVEKKVLGSYADTLETVKGLLAAKAGAFDGEHNWNAHSAGIHALVEVNIFIDSAIDHLRISAGTKEPEMRMPDGSPMPQHLQDAIKGNIEDGTPLTDEQIEHARDTGAYL